MLITVADVSIERAVQYVKGGFAHRAGKELGFRAPVWERRFSESRVLDKRMYDQISEYIRNNPVKRHLVTRAEDYSYSSANTRFELDAPPQRLKPQLLGVAVRHG